MKRVLIIGNGTSRLNYKQFIKNWKDEIWACNRAFKELITGELPRLDRLMGDKNALREASDFRRKNKFNFKIYARKQFHANHISGDKEFITIPEKYIKDSGTTFVVQALVEGYDEIVLVGFDLGGPDIYVANHEKRNKKMWVDRWRQIARDFGLDRIIFIGTDHKKFILSKLPADTYLKKYVNGINHLDPILKKSDKVLILGNGVSRLKYKKFISEWKDEIWVCNKGYTEFKELPRIDRMGSAHANLIIKAYICKMKYKLDYTIFSTKLIDGYEDKIFIFTDSKGWATGPLMVQQALIEDYKKIVLAGFDFGGEDIYQNHLLYGGNFVNQFKIIYKEFSNTSAIEFLSNYPKFLKAI